jgi:hypothetical protein
MADVEIGELVYKIQADVAGFGAKLKEAENAVQQLSKQIEKQTQEQSKAVFNGVAAWDLLKKGIGTATSFLEGSVKESMDAAKTMALVRQNVANAGLSYEKLSVSISSAANSALEMGFDDEQAALSLSRMMLVTNDYDKALALHGLAMDLARNKSIDLATATTLVAQVSQGNNRVLKQYGIELKDDASAADNLASLQSKVKDSAKTFADTAAGKLEVVNQKWNNMKQAVGDQITPALTDLLNHAQEALPAMTDLMTGLAKGIGSILTAISAVDDAWKTWSSWYTESTMRDAAAKTITPQIEEVVRRYNEANKKVAITSEDFVQMAAETQKKILDKYGKGVSATVDVNKKAAASFAGIGLESKASAAEVEKAKKAFDDLQKSLLDTRDKVDELAASFQDKLTQSFADFRTSIEQNITDSQQGLAQIVIKAETDLADAQKQLAEEQAKFSADQDAKKIADLQATIAKEQAILTASAGFEGRLKDRLSSQQAQINTLIANANAETDPITKANMEAEIEARQTAYIELQKFGNLDKQIAEERKVSSEDEFTQYEEQTFQKIQLQTEAFISETTKLREKLELAKSVESEITKYYSQQTALRQATLDAFALSSIATLQRIGSEAQSAMSALSAMQSNQARATTPGKALGGYTVGGEMVHAGEWVMPAWMVRAFGGLVNQLEGVRTGSGASHTVNAPVTINAKVEGPVDFRAVGREMSWELGRL